ncbi:MAG: hypothetical protein ACI8X5_003264 [Planctomycetota bacterium]|jgi:hypothetical protein
MDFEEMKVIWDSQKEQPMLVLDHESLHKDLIRKARRIERDVSMTEIGMILITLNLAGRQAYKPLFDGKEYSDLIGAGLFIGVALWMWIKRVRRRRGALKFEASLRGDLDRSLFQVNYHISLAKTFMWWFMLPALVVIVLDSFQKENAPSFLKVAFVAGSFALGYAVVGLGLRCSQLPQKRNLEALLEKLTNES